MPARPFTRFPSRIKTFAVIGACACAFIAASVLRAQDADDTVALLPVVVRAGAFPTGAGEGSVLTPLEVVMTPGSAADINRALQTLPGVQMVDEGNALFVRGGDSLETATYLNGLRFPQAVQLDTPLGTFTGTISPFQARKITFLAGGFGAPHGHALSAVVDLETQGAPPFAMGSVNVGLASVAAGLDLPLSPKFGVRLTAAKTDTAPMFRLNSPRHDFTLPPRGHDFSLAAGYDYRPGGELKFFALEQKSSVGVHVDEPGFKGVFRNENLNRFSSLSLKDQFGGWSAHVDLGGGRFERDQTIAPGAFHSALDHRQVRAAFGRELASAVHLAAGFEAARETWTYRWRFDRLNPPTDVATRVPETRRALFVEGDAALAPNLRATLGLRAERSTLSAEDTLSPRASLSWRARRHLQFSLAGGAYRQVPDAYHFAQMRENRHALPPMTARHFLAAVQLGGDARFLRVEAYRKTYADLSQLNRAYRPVTGGAGRAEGVDVFAKTELPAEFRVRATYSHCRSERTDPDGGLRARAAFDVRHSGSLILERDFGDWRTGLIWRVASGRPFTPIRGGALTPDGRREPLYGDAFSEEFPPLQRLDLSLSRLWALNKSVVLVGYLSITNILNRANTHAYAYSDDFAERRASPSLYSRTVYLGFNALFSLP